MEDDQPQIRVSADVGKVNMAAREPQNTADEPVSDTDDDAEGGCLGLPKQSTTALLVTSSWCPEDSSPDLADEMDSRCNEQLRQCTGHRLVHVASFSAERCLMQCSDSSIAASRSPSSSASRVNLVGCSVFYQAVLCCCWTSH